MESFLCPRGVTFEILRTRLLTHVRLRIDNGEFTERGLARILGVSQSQTHNVLKGVRVLQIQLADRMLSKLGISVIDLLQQSELSAALPIVLAFGDHQLAAFEERILLENEANPGILPARKIPPARSETRPRQEIHKTG